MKRLIDQPVLTKGEKLIRKLVKRYGEQCFYCGRVSKLTVDHFVPRSKGGSDRMENLRPACVSCNQRKADLMPEEFMKNDTRSVEV